jgi:hypothetical protein
MNNFRVDQNKGVLFVRIATLTAVGTFTFFFLLYRMSPSAFFIYSIRFRLFLIMKTDEIVPKRFTQFNLEDFKSLIFLDTIVVSTRIFNKGTI